MNILKGKVIACRNMGFGDNLMQAANLWFYAKEHKKCLLICWANSRYLQQASNREQKHAEINAFWYFFTLPKFVDGVPIIKKTRVPHKIVQLIQASDKKGSKLNILKGKNPRKNLLVTECVYEGFFPVEQLRPFFYALELSYDLRQKVECFAQKNFANKKVIGVHIRYYPPSLPHSNHTKHWQDEEMAIAKIQRAILDFADTLVEPHVFFLCTDSPAIQEYFLNQTSIPFLTYQRLNSSERNQDIELHHPGNSLQTAENSLAEMFLLAKCNALMRNTLSWFHYYASLFIKEIIDINANFEEG